MDRQQAYLEASMSCLSSSGSSIFSQNVEPESPDEYGVSSPSASFNWDANLDRSHCMYPGIGLRVAKVCLKNEKHFSLILVKELGNLSWSFWVCRTSKISGCSNSNGLKRWQKTYRNMGHVSFYKCYDTLDEKLS